MMKKILLYNYCLSVFLSRKKMHLVKEGTWFLICDEVFFIEVSILMFILSLFTYTVPLYLIISLIFIAMYFTFYRSKKWMYSKMAKYNIHTEFKLLEKKQRRLYVLIGLFLLIGSFAFFCIVTIVTMGGYLLR